MEIKALSVAANIHKNLKPHPLASFFLYLSISGLAVCNKNPRPQTHVRSQTGITVTLPQVSAAIIAAAIRKTQRGCHAAASSFCFLSVSYVLLRFYLELLLVLRRVLFISALTGCFSGPCGLRWKRVPAPKVVPPPAPPLARDAIACSALEERAVYFISLSRRTLSTVLSSSSGERKWHPYAENVRPARVRQQLCPGVG